jgi:hypothetical protein
MKVKKYEEAAALAASSGLRNSCKLQSRIKVYHLDNTFTISAQLKKAAKRRISQYYLRWKDNKQLRKYYENGHKQINKIPDKTLQFKTYFRLLSNASTGNVFRMSACVAQPRLACAIPNFKNAK